MADGPTLRVLLMRRHRLLYDRGMASASENGYGFVTPAMARLFEQIGPGPVSLSELARRLFISRQSLHETITAACEHGLVELVPDDTNKRIRIARFTEAGKRMSRIVVEVDREMERQL